MTGKHKDPFDSQIGRTILHRLEVEEIIWLTTVDASGMPQPRPVWFHWDGETILIYSQKAGAKVRHLRRNPKAALNFNTDPDGGDVGVILGLAGIAAQPVSAERMETYLQKYRVGLQNLGMTFEQFVQDYPVAILVHPLKVRGF